MLLVLSFALITLGLFKPEHTELSLTGFTFLFLLSLSLLNGGVTVQTGTYTNSTFGYSTQLNTTLLTSSYETVTDIYSPVEYDGTLQHIIGVFLAVGSIIGFVGVLISFKKGVPK